MKKLLLFAVLFGVALSSCKKGSTPKPNPSDGGKTYAVKFNVSGFTQEITNGAGQKINGLNTNAVTAPGVQRLYYFAYDNSDFGKLVHRLVQDSSAANFGNVEDNLPAGTYNIVFFAGASDLVYYNTSGFADGFLENPRAAWSDAFSKTLTITVGGGDISQNVTLNRVVGKFTVKLLDVMPANASTLTVTVNKDRKRYLFKSSSPDASSPAPGIFTTTIPASAIGKPNYSFSMLLMAAANDVTVDIKCYDAAKKIIGQALVTNVSVQPNVQTILSGKLFTPDSDFSVGLDTGWDTPIDIQY